MAHKLKNILKSLETPTDPLLGPNLKLLQASLILQTENKIHQFWSYFSCASQFIFVVTQLVDVWLVRDNFSQALENLSVTFLVCVCVTKMLTFVAWQKDWKILAKAISFEELHELERKDPATAKIMETYIRYSRVATYSYSALVGFTNILMQLSPLLQYISVENMRNGTEPKALLLSSWFPFDTTKSPGYWIALAIQIPIALQGGLVISGFDSNAVAIMTFLKGHLKILNEKCRGMFDDDNLDDVIVIERVKECHRQHTHMLHIKYLFNSLLSPVMFLYVLNCSVMICCSVVQLSMGNADASQKLWIIVYTVALICQLFLYCWHGNEMEFEGRVADKGIYESNWWKLDARTQRYVVLLGGKLSEPFILNAGPFTTLSIGTFIEILKGAYSFFTLMAQMQEK